MQDKEEMDTLSEAINSLRKKGYDEEFKIMETGKVCTRDTKHTYTPNQVKIVEHFRFEGESDPGDMTVLYALETEGGEKGFITDGFGTYSSPKTSEFMQKVKELHKGKIY